MENKQERKLLNKSLTNGRTMNYFTLSDEAELLNDGSDHGLLEI